MKRLVRVSQYDAYKDLIKVEKDGEVNDGYGNEYNIPNVGYSKTYTVDSHKFRYNFSTKELELLDENEVIDSISLSASEWVDNPEYWAGNYLENYDIV